MLIVPQVLGYPEDLLEEAALAADSLSEASYGAAASIWLSPESHVSNGLVAHALLQMAAGMGSIGVSNVKVGRLVHCRHIAVILDYCFTWQKLHFHACAKCFLLCHMRSSTHG